MARRKDVQIHAAVTIMPNVNSIPLVGEKEIEICQFAVQLDAKFLPLRQKYVKAAFDGLFTNCLEKMRTAGLLKEGE